MNESLTQISVKKINNNKVYACIYREKAISKNMLVNKLNMSLSTVEKNLKAASIITKNYESLGLIPNLITGDSLKYLKSTGENFDIIYIDPPYESGLYEKVFPHIKQNTLVILEHSEPIVSGMRHLKEKNYGGKLVTFIQF